MRPAGRRSRPLRPGRRASGAPCGLRDRRGARCPASRGRRRRRPRSRGRCRRAACAAGAALGDDRAAAVADRARHANLLGAGGVAVVLLRLAHPLAPAAARRASSASTAPCGCRRRSCCSSTTTAAGARRRGRRRPSSGPSGRAARCRASSRRASSRRPPSIGRRTLLTLSICAMRLFIISNGLPLRSPPKPPPKLAGGVGGRPRRFGRRET